MKAGASLLSSAIKLGVTYHTVRNWLKRGMQEQNLELETPYVEFVTDVQEAIAQATVEAEQQVKVENPEWYLTRGPGRVIVGDTYNIVSKSGEVNYNLDGSVSPNVVDDLAIRKNEPRIEQEAKAIEQEFKETSMLDALIAAYKSGIDINTIVRGYIEQHRPEALNGEDEGI